MTPSPSPQPADGKRRSRIACGLHKGCQIGGLLHDPRCLASGHTSPASKGTHVITTSHDQPPARPSWEEGVEKDRQQLLHLITTLQQSYTSVGVFAWLLSKNATTHNQAPIQVWLDGERQEVLDAADAIEGGL